ncbi:carbohydrate kinase, FGGY family protein [Pseudoramibacter alactolyticus ATCC 23263]|uniref:Carbohydrate kinase, FGGY family protein n=1 Tax=Pseudoramibacter alactolyticus ATCC 23263 TaxID=887929 RepID=E6MG38_9FIRM|nr:FGGY family carbohydrate kinase [Pseudoramibacter alactolyticus]EFV01578.1 carbohydrate kinase, FGGY family protein [Pseudoramibacter alactolyticus ATCC 23263]
MAQYICGIDAGTTGTKIMIFTVDGIPVSHAYKEYSCKYPHPGWVEQDPWELWHAICEITPKAIAKADIDPKEIGSIAISSQRGTFFAIDKDWNPIEDSIVWSDSRAIKEIKWIGDTLGAEHYHEISGAAMTSLWAYAKYKWVHDNKPALYDKAWKFVNGQEWLLHQLGSEELFTDPSSLALNGMMDVKTLDWSDELLDAIGVSRDKLPPIKEPARQVGVVSEIASELTCFAQGTPICVGGGDQQCAAVGAGVIKEGLAEISIGTAAVMVAAVDNIYPDPQQEVLFSGHANPGKWDMEGLAYSSGASLKWWRDTYGDTEAAVARATGTDVYTIISDKEAARAPVGCNGFMFLPFLATQVSPYYCDTATGGSIGLTNGHDRPMMARAVLEGVAFELRMIVDAMQHVLGRPFDTILLSGGGSKSPTWRQIQADMYGCPVEVLETADCGLVGAAALGATGVGIYKNLKEACNQMVHPKNLIEPNMANYKLYTDMFEIFRDTFLTLRDVKIYDRLNALSIKYWG